MGNSQLPAQQQPYILPRKVQHLQQKEALEDLNQQIKQVFGTIQVPLSKRVIAPSSPQARRLFDSLLVQSHVDQDNAHQERIANLEQEIQYLKSLLTQMHHKDGWIEAARSQLGQSLSDSQQLSSRERWEGEGSAEEAEREMEREREDDAEPENEASLIMVREINASLSRVSQTYFESRRSEAN